MLERKCINLGVFLLSFLFSGCLHWFFPDQAKVRFEYEDPPKDAKLHIVTFNTALLSLIEFGPLRVNIVACVAERMKIQNRVLFESFSPGVEHEAFGLPRDRVVLKLQEVWSRDAYNLFRDSAHRAKLNVIPPVYESKILQQSGLMIVTNLNVDGYNLEKFKVPHGPKEKGILFANLRYGDMKISVANVHTAYSDLNKPYSDHLSHLEDVANALSNTEDLYYLSGDFNTGPNAGFAGEKYDSSEVLWKKGLIEKIQNAGEWSVAPLRGNTWDRDNFIARTLPMITRAYNGGVREWDDENASIDHIFWKKSDEISKISEAIIFKDKYRLNRGTCENLTTINLSDHYGVRASYIVKPDDSNFFLDWFSEEEVETRDYSYQYAH